MIAFDYNTSGLTTLYATMAIDKQIIKISNGALQTMNSANWASSAITLSDTGTLGHYFANVPAGTPAGTYIIRVSSNASPAIADVTLGVSDLVWSGAAEVGLDLTQVIPTSNTAQTLGDALNAARAQGFGKWSIVGTALTLYAGDGTTIVRTFTLNDPTFPTQRT